MTSVTTISQLLAEFQERTGATDDQLARDLGYTSGAIVAMFKDGRMRVPVNKVSALADAIGVDRRSVLRSVLKDSAPDLLQALDDAVPALTWSDGDTKLVELLKTMAGGRKSAPVVFDGAKVIALVAV